MLSVFEHRLDKDLVRAGLRPDLRAAIESQATRLAAVQIPPAATPEERESTRTAVTSAFLEGFRRVMLIGSGLALLAAASALWLIDGKKHS